MQAASLVRMSSWMMATARWVFPTPQGPMKSEPDVLGRIVLDELPRDLEGVPVGIVVDSRNCRGCSSGSAAGCWPGRAGTASSARRSTRTAGPPGSRRRPRGASPSPGTCRRPLVRSIQISSEVLELVRPAELAHGLLLDLADPLPGQLQLVADLLEGPRPVVVQPEAQF